jgi:hypothetical protein
MKQTPWLCPGCGYVKVLENDFHRLKRTRTGYKPRCKDCSNAAHQEWRANNPKKENAQQKRTYKKHRTARLAAHAEWEKENRESINEKRRARYAKRKGEASE